LRENIFVEKALLGERAKEAKHIIRQSDGVRSAIVGKALRRPVRAASSGTPRIMVEPSAQRRKVFWAMTATSSVPNTLSFLTSKLLRSCMAEALEDRRI
jgi:hypothetical protein